MSDSGSTQFPAGPKLAEQSVPSGQSDVRTGELVNVPEDLREVREPERLRGDVVRHNDDGSVTVRTQRGDVDVRLPPDQPQPRQGQSVELEIQTGNPPAQTTIRPAQTRTVQPQPQPEQTAVPSAPQRPAITPVNVEVRHNMAYEPPVNVTTGQTPANTEEQLRTLPEPGTLARLQSIPVRETAVLLAEFTPEILVVSLTTPTLFEASVVAAEAQAINLENTLIIAPDTFELIIQTRPENFIAAAPSVQNILSTFTPQAVLADNTPPHNSLAFELITPTPGPRFSLFNLPSFSFFSEPPAMNLPQPVSLLPVNLEALQTQTAQLPITLPADFTQIPLAPSHTPQILDVRIEQIELPKVIFTTPAETNLDVRPQLPVDDLRLSVAENHQAGSLRAVVTGMTAEQLPVLGVFLPQGETPHLFALHIPVDEITPGTQITLTPQSTASLVQPAAVAAQPLSSFLMPGAWPVMQDLYQTLAQTNPALAQVLNTVTPNPASPAQLTPAALFFLAAVRAGDIGGWLGDKTMDILRREGRNNLLARLAQEGNILSRLATEPVSQDWRALPLPLTWENEMQKMTLFYRHEGGGPGDEREKGKQIRFIFDLNLSHMGPVQVDGLFRPGRLDIILRTEEPFSQAMQMEMRRLYTQTLGQTEITGELDFQNQPEQWVRINVDEEAGDSVMA